MEIVTFLLFILKMKMKMATPFRVSSAMDSTSEWDEPVRATNSEAAACKAGAVQRGYWRDEALLRLAAAARFRPDRKPPEISRGYFARVQAVQTVVDRFLDIAGSECQIVNLGCGFDTLYWKLHEAGAHIRNFIEIDFPSIVSRKCHAIEKDKCLKGAICKHDSELVMKDGDLHAKAYHLLGCDLRQLPEVQKKLEKCGVAFDLPTLFISECVLVYIKPEPCRVLLSWIAQKFTNSILASYEQVNLNDKFGEVMLANLSARGCVLAGAEFCMSLETQKQRFLSCGWKCARAWDMETIWNSLSHEDRRRVEAIEMLDERVLLIQLLQHYCVVLAINGELLRTISMID